MCGTCVSKLVSGEVDIGWLEALDDGSPLTPEQVKVGGV